jgi:hypothetical protein
MGSAEDATAYPPVSGWTERTPPSHPPEGPDAARSSVVMVNQTGTHRWTKHQLNTLLGVSCA